MKQIVLIFLLISSLYSFSQDEKEVIIDNVELQNALLSLEEIFNIKFSYNSTLVENKFFSYSQKNMSLKQVLIELERQSNIVYEKVNERFYVLKNKLEKRICGYIKDELTGIRIENATILNLETNKGTTTNDEGYFELEFLSNETIEVRFLGYKTQSVKVEIFKSNPCFTVTLIQDEFQINEVIIREYITSGIVKKRDGSITLKTKTLGILPGLIEPDILQNLQLIPGITSPTETASELYIRGGTPDQNLILYDGVKMFYSGHFFGMISAFNPYIISEVKLYKGGGKAQYGNHISGVIDIISEKNIPNKIKGNLGFNMTHADANISIPITEKLGLTASVRRSISDLFQSNTFNNFSDKVFQNTKISEGNRIYEDDDVINLKDQFYFTDYTIKTNYKPTEKDQFTFSTISVNNTLDYSFLIEDFNEKSTDKLAIENKGSSVNWNHNYSDNFSHEFNIYYSTFELEYKGENFIEDNLEEDVVKENSIKDFTTSFRTKWSLNERQNLNLGYEFSSNKVGFTLGYNNTFDTDDNYNDSLLENNNSQAFYSEYQYDDKKWFVNLGLRTNYFSLVDKVFLEPRIQVERKLNSNFRINFSAEKNNQFISQVVEFNTQDFGLENQIWVLSDKEEISVLNNHQFTTGLNFKKNNWNIDIEGYLKRTNGLNTFTRGFSTSNDTFLEGKSNIIGVDVLIKKRIADYSTFLSYTLSNNKYKFNAINNGASFNGNQDTKHQFSWSHAYRYKEFDFSLGWNYRTGIPYTNASELLQDNQQDYYINYGQINAKRLPDYHRLDFSATYKFLFSKNEKVKGKIGFSLLNIYNQKNILSRKYDIRLDADDEAKLQEQDKFSLGVTPNFVFRFNF